MKRFIWFALFFSLLFLPAEARRRFIPKISAGVVTYDFKETFEVPTTGYDNASWSPTGTVAPASTAIVLQGAQSCAITAGDILRAYTGVTSGTQYGFCEIQITTLSSGFVLVKWFDSGFGTQFQIELNGTKLRIYSGSSLSSDGATTISAATKYYLWYDSLKGSGANAVAHVYVSTTSTKPGAAECTVTNGTTTADVAYIQHIHNVAGIFDAIVMNSTAIGSNPVP